MSKAAADIVSIVEVVACHHPTEYDPIGKDGLYIKSVRIVGNFTRPADEDYTNKQEQAVIPSTDNYIE